MKNILVIDGGDALAIGLPGDEKEMEKARKRGKFVLNLLEKIGYEALNLGETDLVLGIPTLKALQKDSKVHLLSANLKNRKTGKAIFEPFLVKEIGELRIGIIGLLTSDLPPYIEKEMKDYFIEDPVKVAAETASLLKPHCDYLICLAHLQPSEIESLAREVPQISIIIGGHDRSLILPRQINHSIWVQTDAFGLHVGRLNLRLVKGSSEFVPRSLIQEAGESPLDKKRKNSFENLLVLLHSGMGADPEIENWISSSNDELKRPMP